jgi:hypothetical protein
MLNPALPGVMPGQKPRFCLEKITRAEGAWADNLSHFRRHWNRINIAHRDTPKINA